MLHTRHGTTAGGARRTAPDEPSPSGRTDGSGRTRRSARAGGGRRRGTPAAAAAGFLLTAALVASPQLAPGHGASAAAADCPWVGSSAPVAERVDQVLAATDQDQKLTLLHGNGDDTPYIGNLDGIPELCVPAMGFHDGPSGVGDGFGPVLV